MHWGQMGQMKQTNQVPLLYIWAASETDSKANLKMIHTAIKTVA